MYFALLMGTFVIGIAAMLGIMGFRQWQMGYRLSGGISLIVSVGILLGGVIGAYVYID